MMKTWASKKLTDDELREADIVWSRLAIERSFDGRTKSWTAKFSVQPKQGRPTLAQLGKKYGISIKRVRQIERQGIRRVQRLFLGEIGYNVGLRMAEEQLFLTPHP